MSTGDVDRGEMPDELDTFLDDLRSSAADTPAPLPGDALATLFRDGTAPVVTPPRRRWAVRAVVAGAVGGLAFGGLGVAGALPRPMQQRVADVVDHVGVHLPDPRPAVTTATVPPTTVTTGTTTSPSPVQPRRPAATPSTVDDQGKGGNEDAGGSDDASGDDRSGADDSSKGTDQNDAQSRNQSDDGANPRVEESGRNPDATDDVHLPEGSDHSGHDSEGRTG